MDPRMLGAFLDELQKLSAKKLDIKTRRLYANAEAAGRLRSAQGQAKIDNLKSNPKPAIDVNHMLGGKPVETTRVPAARVPNAAPAVRSVAKGEGLVGKLWSRAKGVAGKVTRAGKIGLGVGLGGAALGAGYAAVRNHKESEKAAGAGKITEKVMRKLVDAAGEAGHAAGAVKGGIKAMGTKSRQLASEVEESFTHARANQAASEARKIEAERALQADKDARRSKLISQIGSAGKHVGIGAGASLAGYGAYRALKSKKKES